MLTKNIKYLFFVVLLLFLSACGEKNNPSGNDEKLIGRWMLTTETIAGETETITETNSTIFNADGTYEINNLLDYLGCTIRKGSWETSDNFILLIPTSSNGLFCDKTNLSEHTWNYTVDSSTLTLSDNNDNGNWTQTYEKIE